VLSPQNVPKVTSPDIAEQNTALASLSVIVPSADLDNHVIMRALSTAMQTCTPTADMSLSSELEERGLGKSPAAQLWSSLMAVDLSFFQSETSQQLRKEGRVRGRAQAVAEFLGARGVEVSEAARERILSCGDEEVLGAWVVRAATAASVEELWGDGDVRARVIAARSESSAGAGGA
jgi:hypothetical protein